MVSSFARRKFGIITVVYIAFHTEIMHNQYSECKQKRLWYWLFWGKVGYWNAALCNNLSDGFGVEPCLYHPQCHGRSIIISTSHELFSVCCLSLVQSDSPTLGHYLLHISFSSPAHMLFWDPLHWPLLCILPISRSVRVDAADLHVDLLLSGLQNS